MKKSVGERLTPKENVLPTRNACHFDGGRLFSRSCACDYSAHVSEDAIQAVDTLRAELDKKKSVGGNLSCLAITKKKLSTGLNRYSFFFLLASILFATLKERSIYILYENARRSFK
ncbi:hypothetical protein [Paranoxybacillus vitaminiphilus]|uniref:hypothetical protein n=1 Tax=Paranoxybacillus vitaminiphilus TaxID=581036 RepID=UPI000DB9984B|nr:hypothetical protein [Anoxybacillus vitaminiphilus]